MATMGMIKAAVVAAAFAGSVSTALAAEPVAGEATAQASAEGPEASAEGPKGCPEASAEGPKGCPEASGIDGSGQDSGVQAYCYWQTYCNVYGYCWTSWVCF